MDRGIGARAGAHVVQGEGCWRCEVTRSSKPCWLGSRTESVLPSAERSHLKPDHTCASEETNDRLMAAVMVGMQLMAEVGEWRWRV